MNEPRPAARTQSRLNWASRAASVTSWLSSGWPVRITCAAPEGASIDERQPLERLTHVPFDLPDRRARPRRGGPVLPRPGEAHTSRRDRAGACGARRGCRRRRRALRPGRDRCGHQTAARVMVADVPAADPLEDDDAGCRCGRDHREDRREHRGDYFTWRPPSTRRVSPVMKSQSSSASTALAISSLAAPAPERRGLSRRRDVPRRSSVGGAHNRPRRNGVHQDVVGGELERQRLGQRDHSRLRHVVRKIASIARAPLPAVQSLKLMMRPPPCRRMCGAAASAQRKLPRRSTSSVAVPVGRREIVERAPHVHGRHVDQDVEPSEFFSGGADERLARGGLRDIGLHDLGTPARRAHALERPVPPRRATGVAEHDVDAARGQLARHHEADALAAGDQRNLVGEFHEPQMQPRKHEDTKKKFSSSCFRGFVACSYAGVSSSSSSSVSAAISFVAA